MTDTEKHIEVLETHGEPPMETCAAAIDALRAVDRYRDLFGLECCDTPQCVLSHVEKTRDAAIAALREVEGLRTRNLQIGVNNAALTAQLTDAHRMLKESAEDLHDFCVEVDQLKAQLTDAKREIEGLRARPQVAGREVLFESEQEAALKAQLADAKRDVEELRGVQKEYFAIRQAYSDLEAQHARVTAERDGFESALRGAHTIEAALQKQLAATLRQIEQWREEINFTRSGLELNTLKAQIARVTAERESERRANAATLEHVLQLKKALRACEERLGEATEELAQRQVAFADGQKSMRPQIHELEDRLAEQRGVAEVLADAEIRADRLERAARRARACLVGVNTNCVMQLDAALNGTPWPDEDSP